MIALGLMIAALVLALLAALGVPSGRFGLFPAAFACFILALLIGRG